MAYDGKLTFLTAIDSTGISTGLKVVGGLIATAAGALTGLATKAIKMGSDFEAQMSRVSAIAGAYGDDLVRLTEQAKQLGADTAFSASEAAAGMENLASAGFSVEEIMGAMPGLLDLAAVSGGNVAAAAEVAAAALNGFGIEASDAAHVADVFARAAADTNAEALDMGEAMKYVAPVAHAMGLSLEETAAAIGIMSDAGIKGGQAGTALRAALSRLAKPTKVMRETMEELGLSFYDAAGEMLPLEGQIKVLQDGLAGLTQEERNNALVTLYGQEALSGMLALIEAGPEKLAALAKSLEESDGAAQQMAKTIRDNLKGDIEALGGSLETLAIQFYESVRGPLRDVVQSAGESIDQLSEAFQRGGLEALVSQVGNVLADWANIVISAAPEIVKAAISLLSSFIGGITSNIGLLSKAALDIVMMIIKSILSLAPKLLQAGIEIIVALATGVGGALPELMKNVVGGVKLIGQTLVDNIPELITAAIALVGGLVEGLIQAIPVLIEGAKTLMVSLYDELQASAPLIMEAAPEMIGKLVVGLLDAIPLLLDAAISIVLALIDFTLENLEPIVGMATEILTKVTSALIEAIPQLVSAALQIIQKLVEYVLNNAPQLSTLAMRMLMILAKGLVDNIPTLVQSAKTMISNFASEFSNYDWASIGSRILDGLINGIRGGVDKVISAASSVVDAVKNTFTSIKGFDIRSPSRWGRNVVGARIPEGVALGVEDESDDMVMRISRTIDRAKDISFSRDAAIGGRASIAAAVRGSSVTHGDVHLGGITIVVDGYIEDEDTTNRIARAIATRTSEEMRRRGVVMV